MRIHLKTTPSVKTIDFNYLHLLTGTIHKWLGKNNFHHLISLYSFSNLRGGEAKKNGLDFLNGATFFISCWDNNQAQLLITGIQNNPEMFFGLRVVEIVLQENPELIQKTHFQLGSPVFIQRSLKAGSKRFYFYDDIEAPTLMVETLNTKMRAAGLRIDETLKISFEQSYQRKGTKKIAYKRGDQITQIRANWCPIIIEGKPETKVFAWNVGIGNSTGIGFGSIK